jgi:hypothetical protein
MNEDGSRTATATAGTTAGTAKIKAKGSYLLSASCTIKVKEDKNLLLSISASPDILPADGKSQTALTIKVLDENGHIDTTYNGSVSLKSSNGSVLKIMKEKVEIKKGRGAAKAKSGTTPAEVTVSATGTNLKETSLKIIVVKLSIHLSKSKSCDGTEVEIGLSVEPSSAKSRLGNIEFKAAKPNGKTDFDNPVKKGIAILQSGGIAKWKVDNLRWYSTKFNHSNETSTYKITASCNIDNVLLKTNSVYLTADTTFGSCFDGRAWITSEFSGSPHYVTVLNPQTGLYETTISQGTFKRDVQSESWWKAPKKSQYYEMIKNEEEYHEKNQHENPNHYIFGRMFLVENIMNDVQVAQPYVNATEKESLKVAQDFFEKFQIKEFKRSVLYKNDYKCEIEREAKQAVGASYRCAMPSAYPECR